jgi:hypothetical protein
VDFAGPFQLKFGGPRSQTTTKSYISVFLGMATKAIHLECVTSLATEAFLAAFDRFVSRRGLTSDMHSDNGLNFVGADSELRETYKRLSSPEFTKYVQNNPKYESVKWHFIPPRSPNFGGLWESSVKLVKHHLVRMVLKRLLTYEEMSTVLYQIKAVLNSRPICPESEDPNDLKALTPGHFLIGRPLNARPQEDFTNLPDTYLRSERLDILTICINSNSTINGLKKIRS